MAFNLYNIIFLSLLFLLLYPYLFYPLILKIISLFKQAKYSIPDNDYLPFITFIVPAYNEESVIKDKINNLLNLSYPKAKKEILIISDGSTDRTAEIVNEVNEVNFVNLTKRIGKPKILNLYIPKAKGEIVILSDANTFFEQDAAKNLVQYFSSKNVGSVCGKLAFKGMKEEIKYWNYENTLKKLENDIEGLFGANGAIYAIRKKYFRKMPDDTIIDDIMIPLLIYSGGNEIIFSNESKAWELVSCNWRNEFRRRRRIGFGNLQLLSYLFKRIINLKGMKLFSFISHKIIRWLAPILLIALFILNIFLIKDAAFLGIFILQALFYVNALFFNNIASYFVRMNFALLCGYTKFMRGDSEDLW